MSEIRTLSISLNTFRRGCLLAIHAGLSAKRSRLVQELCKLSFTNAYEVIALFVSCIVDDFAHTRDIRWEVDTHSLVGFVTREHV